MFFLFPGLEERTLLLWCGHEMKYLLCLHIKAILHEMREQQAHDLYLMHTGHMSVGVRFPPQLKLRTAPGLCYSCIADFCVCKAH